MPFTATIDRKGNEKVRIITGSAKGKRLITLEGEATRPTSERIKEAMFSSIQFDVEDRRVLDLFAGSGQLGLEALSRGAESVTFVDSEREAMDVVKSNAKSTGFFDKCRYCVSDWRNFIRKSSGKDVYDLVFIDPPYAMECACEAVKRLAEEEIIIPGAIIVVETGAFGFDADALFGYEIIKSTHYGKKTFVNILLYKGEGQ